MKNIINKITKIVLAFSMVITLLTVNYVDTKAVTNFTNPFTQGTLGSNSYRIPAVVTLDNGTIVAAADARWNSTYDGGGIDTAVAYSTNNGQSWTTKLVNYLGDNGNVYNGSSTAFIDPALATDGSTVYMLVDLYPYGVALNGSGNTAPTTQTGFDSQGRLLLSNNNHTSYNYYLYDGKIYSSAGAVQSNYTVDEYFNITSTDGTVSSNLFYENSPFKVQRTNYLYLTKSTDGGVNWSTPQLLNVKTTNEQAYLVGPGNAIVTKNKTIVYPCYAHNGSESTQQMSFIYSTDGGVNWKRTANYTGASWSSEGSIIELSNGTLRFFYRNGTTNLCYVDYNMTSNTWGTEQNTQLDTNSNCQISSIVASQTSNGKQVVLVSCPTGENNAGSNQSGASYRLNGRIFIGTIEANQSMNWVKTIDVTANNSPFMYSSLTEYLPGQIGILYENKENKWGAGSDEHYYTMTTSTYSLSDYITLDTSSEEETQYDKTIELFVGNSTTIKDTTGDYGDTTINKNVADVIVDGTTIEGSNEEVVTSITSGNSYYIKNNNEYLVNNNGTLDWTSDINSASLWTITKNNSNYYIYNNGYYVYSNGSSINASNRYESYWKYNDSYEFYNTYWSWGSNRTVTLGQAVTKGTQSEQYTDITFTAKNVGTTYVTVGDTTYKIIVNKKTVDTSVMLGETVSFVDASTTVTVANTSIASASFSNGNLIIKGLTEGTTVVETTNVKYNVTVMDGYTLSIKENETLIISPSDIDGDGTDDKSFTLGDGQYIEWSTSDSSTVGVAGKYDSTNKKYGDEACIIGHNVNENPTVVTAKIYNSDGSLANSVKWLVTVTQGDADTNTTSKHIYVNVKTILNCTVYYSINGGELIKINGTGVLVDQDVKGHYNIMFFAAPDEGYALTNMTVTGSALQYYTLSDGNPDGTGSGAWPFNSESASSIPSSSGDSAWVSGHGFRWALLEGNMTIEQMKLLFSNAITLGCDGATNFTKNANESFYTEVQFVAQKLPTLEKEIISITSNGTTTPYSEGMKVDLGDTINYKITITEHAEEVGDLYNSQSKYTVTSPITSTNKPTYNTGSYGTITYSNDELIDQLTNSSYSPSYESLGTSSIEKEEHEYLTSLTLSAGNFNDVVKNGRITNTADLNYHYSSQYSTGNIAASSSAVADIQVTLPEYIIDFGLPVNITLDQTDLGTNVNISSGRANYGTVSCNNSNTFVYTPTQVLKSADFVVLTLVNTSGTEVGHYGVTVYPATTMYYEETFATKNDSNWLSNGTSSNLTQATTVVDDDSNIDLYGYDSSYSTNGSNSNNTVVNSTAKGATLSIDFNGTGIELYNLTTSQSGTLAAYLYDNANKLVKVGYVNTANNFLTTEASVNNYNTPVYDIEGLTPGDYRLEIVALHTNGVLSFDGFRVYDTHAGEYDDVYAYDQEDNSQSVEIRDVTIAAATYNLSDISDYYTVGNNIINAVYDATNNGTGAVILSETTGSNITVDANTINNGPKNEVYLKPGETIAMNIAGTYSKLLVGIRSLNGGTVNYTINGVANTNNSTVDMYYEVTTNNNGDLVISNTGSTVIALTKIKATQYVTLEETGTLAASISSDATTMRFALRCVANDVADYSELNQLINKEYNEELYTPSSYAIYQDALLNAKEVSNNDEATQEEVDTAILELQKAIDGLVEKADKTELEILCNEELDENDYTDESWSIYKNALNDANEVLLNENASQDEVDNALLKLQNAKNALVFEEQSTINSVLAFINSVIDFLKKMLS